MDSFSHASSGILINEKRSYSFAHSKGLKQGDFMSPYLFNICIDVLSNWINQACVQKDWTLVWVGWQRVSISHLLYADDLLLFGRVDEYTMFTLMDILKRFCQVSGQKINEDKSRLIFSPNTLEEHKNLFQNILSIGESKNLGMYLGLPILHKCPPKSEIQFIIEKMKGHLASWKTIFFAKSGTLVSYLLHP